MYRVGLLGPNLKKRGLASWRFVRQSPSMNTSEAGEHLQVIRTLMERAALYRRALAPVMMTVGSIGIVGAIAGRLLGIYRPSAFVAYWYCVAVAAIGLAFFLVRKQALKDGEEFWSLPTRRVGSAMLPPLTAGCIIGLLFLAADLFPKTGGQQWLPAWSVLVGLPSIWSVLSGCALHAAGFFTQRGLRLFGWILIFAGCSGFLLPVPDDSARLFDWSYSIMGAVFGGLHLAYGVYLYFTEKHKAL